jgi:cytochrome oxidase Cu insertion factor (SCO1/SenC/PrrC family)
MSTLEEIEAAVQQLPPAKRAEFRAWFLSFDASDWDQQMLKERGAGKVDGIANEAISDSQAGRCSEL